ncbi:MAG: hypothetical protein FWG87_09185 [Defluviitaleaceae bacterium]|nr:hypothetical protein [Defluviitaleaceae bacterium]
MKIYIAIYVAVICLFMASCQSESIIEANQDSFSDMPLSPITITDTATKDELLILREDYERVTRLRNILSNDYRYAINQITPTLSPETSETIISGIDKNVINAIRNRDFLELTSYIHPLAGVRISLFNEASTEDTILYRNDLTSNDRVYAWGKEWWTGDVISTSISELFDTWLYKKDYVQYAPIFNSSGSQMQDYATGNEYIFYDKCIAVLYLYEGDENSYWLDWSGLKLIYQEYAESWYLAGIIYCERVM